MLVVAAVFLVAFRCVLWYVNTSSMLSARGKKTLQGSIRYDSQHTKTRTIYLMIQVMSNKQISGETP